MQSSALFTSIEKDVSTSKEIQPHLLHLKYSLPAQRLCMYVCRRCQYSKTWKLSYLLGNGGVDGKQLPKAIQSIVSNYRGARVSTVPEQHIPAVLECLARAAERLQKNA
jgi:hypothetical protein